MIFRKMKTGLKTLAKDPKLLCYTLFLHLAKTGVMDRIPDKQYLQIIYKIAFGKKLNLDEPKTFNEKLQWCKLYDRNPVYSKMVDKYEVKSLVTKKIGLKYVIPTIGVWENFDDINFSILPNQFVLKCTHDSGSVIVCRDKSTFDISAAKKKLERAKKRNHYYLIREWPYKNIAPRIMAEKYVQDGNSLSLPVYKFFCFNGEPKIIQVIQNDKCHDECINYYDIKWELLDIRQDYPNCSQKIDKPATLEEMINIAKQLSKDKRGFIRVDLYQINGEVFFSEFTFYSDAGMAPFKPESWDYTLGKWFDLFKK